MGVRRLQLHRFSLKDLRESRLIICFTKQIIDFIFNWFSSFNLFLAGDSNFIKTLINFDKNNITSRVLKKTGQFCTLSDFQPDVIGKVSLAAKSLCMWVRAMEVSSSMSACKLCNQTSVRIINKSKFMWPFTVELQVYGRIYRIVEPKQALLKAATEQLEEKQAALAAAQEKLQEVPIVQINARSSC